MKFFLRFNSILLFAVAAAGCATDNEKITFSDDRMSHIHDESYLAPTPKPTLKRQDLIKVEIEIFSYLLQRNLDENGNYSAVFLEADDVVTETLAKKFPKNIPPIKPMWHVIIRSGQSPLDMDTGRPAMVLSVNALDPENGTVMAVGRWFAGDAVTGFYTFELGKNGDDWMIQSVK